MIFSHPPSHPVTSTLGDLNDSIYIGLFRSDCARRLAENNLKTVLFATWLMVPELGLLLTFRHQRCVAVEVIETIAPKYNNDSSLNRTHQHKPVTCHYAISS